MEALTALRAALNARSEARTTIAAIDAVYGEDWASLEAGITRPTTGDGKPIRG